MGIQRSTNFGRAWFLSNNGISNEYGIADKGLYGITSMDSLLFIATDGGVYKSTDDGINWVKSSNGLEDTSVVTLTTNGAKIFAGTNNGGVYMSIDYGDTWTEFNNNLSSNRITRLNCIDSLVFANHYHDGISVTNENYNYWQHFDDGLSDRNFYIIAEKDDTIFVSSSDRLWKRSLSEIVTFIDNDIQDSPINEYLLCQNYPNPFNPKTNIPFYLPSVSFVSLKVYDILGREVVTLINGELVKGNHSYIWDATGMTSGIYFYSLKTNTYFETKKMLLLR